MRVIATGQTGAARTQANVFAGLAAQGADVDALAAELQ